MSFVNIFCGVQKDNCLSFVRTRKSGVCFASKQNDEEREARNFCDDKNLLVEETTCTPARIFCQHCYTVRMIRRFLNPSSLPNWGLFSQIVITENDTESHVYISGQVGVDSQKKIVSHDFKEQVSKSFENLAEALSYAGAKPTDVVQVRFYIVNYDPSLSDIIANTYTKVFNHTDLPTSTWVGVQALAIPGIVFEVEAVAIIEK